MGLRQRPRLKLLLLFALFGLLWLRDDLSWFAICALLALPFYARVALKIPYVLQLIALISAAGYFLGNWAFSPDLSDNKDVFWRLTFNRAGAAQGAKYALRMLVYYFASLAFLFSCSFTELFESATVPPPSVRLLKPIRRVCLRWNRFILSIFRNFQILRLDLTACARSLRARGFRIQPLRYVLPRRDWKAVKTNLITAEAILVATFRRSWTRLSEFAFAIARHPPHQGQASEAPLPTGHILSVQQATVWRQSDAAPVLSNVNLSAATGDLIVVSGDDMSGKSTLLRCLAGIIPKLEGSLVGTLRVADKELLKTETLSEWLLNVDYVSNEPTAMLLGLTVEAELALLAESHGAAIGLAAQFGLTTCLKQEVTTLSGGEQCRLVLAGLIARSVQLFLVDDIAGHLDPEGRGTFAEMVQTRSRAGCTAFVADPDLAPNLTMVTRCLVTANGGVDVESSPSQEARMPVSEVSSEPVPRADGERLAWIENLTYYAGDRILLSRFDFEVRRSDRIWLHGRNGSGKTTAMMVCARLIPVKAPSTVGSLSPEGAAGYAFQNPALQLTARTVAGEISMWPKAAGLAEEVIAEYLDAVLGLIGCSGESDPGNLPWLKMKLLSLASVSLVPEVVIADEPIAGLCRRGKTMFFEFLRFLEARLQKTVVVISHNTMFSDWCSRTVDFDAVGTIDRCFVGREHTADDLPDGCPNTNASS